MMHRVPPSRLLAILLAGVTGAILVLPSGCSQDASAVDSKRRAKSGPRESVVHRIKITSPGPLVTSRETVIRGTVTPPTRVSIDGQVVDAADGRFELAVDQLGEREYRVTAEALDPSGHATAKAEATFRVDVTAPMAEITSPRKRSPVGKSFVITGRVRDTTSVTVQTSWSTNTVEVTPGGDGAFSLPTTGTPPEAPLIVTFTDAAGHPTRVDLESERDFTPPTIDLTTVSPLVTREDGVWIEGSVRDAMTGIDHCEIDGKPVTLAATGAMREWVALPSEGRRAVIVKAGDRVGNVEEQVLSVVVDRTPPHVTVENVEELRRVSPGARIVYGRVADASSTTLRCDDQPVAVGEDGSFEQTVEFVELGEYTLTLLCIDAAGNQNEVPVVVQVLPPCDVCHGTGDCETCDGRGTACGQCGGDGSVSVPCRVCDGKQKVTCVTCSGSGAVYRECSTCGASGRTQCSRCSGQAGQIITCSKCKGTGWLRRLTGMPAQPWEKNKARCNDCHGAGTRPAKCNTCGIAGTVTCSSCHGSPSAPCSECGGRRATACTACDGGNQQRECDRCHGKPVRTACQTCSGDRRCGECGGSGTRR